MITRLGWWYGACGFLHVVKSFDHPVTSAVESRVKYFRNTIELANFSHELIEKLRSSVGNEVIWCVTFREMYSFMTRTTRLPASLILLVSFMPVRISVRLYFIMSERLIDATSILHYELEAPPV
jgi:hypothetical protein